MVRSSFLLTLAFSSLTFSAQSVQAEAPLPYPTPRGVTLQCDSGGAEKMLKAAMIKKVRHQIQNMRVTYPSLQASSVTLKPYVILQQRAPDKSFDFGQISNHYSAISGSFDGTRPTLAITDNATIPLIDGTQAVNRFKVGMRATAKVFIGLDSSGRPQYETRATTIGDEYSRRTVYLPCSYTVIK